jgi:DNA-binding transcriptional regulator YiaG
MAGPKKGTARRVAPVCPPEWKDVMLQARNIRIANGLSTRTVAEACNVNISTISAWEIGHQAPHPWDWITYLNAIKAHVLLESLT